MGDANTPQQGQESVARKTFYVLRNTTYNNWFTKTLVYGSPSSFATHTVDSVTQYQTLADAVNAQKAASKAVPECRYEIVMVSRSVTKGVLKSPAKTVRRVLSAGDASTVFKYAVGYQNSPLSQLYLASNTDAWGAGNLESAILHSTEGQALRHLQKIAMAAGYSWENTKLVRVVEEKAPEVRTEDVVKDILTPLP